MSTIVSGAEDIRRENRSSYSHAHETTRIHREMHCEDVRLTKSPCPFSRNELVQFTLHRLNKWKKNRIALYVMIALSILGPLFRFEFAGDRIMKKE